MIKKSRITLQDIVPFAAFFVIFFFFAIVSKGRMLSAYNLSILLDQSIMTIVVGCGALFVVAQGSIDLSVGVNLALTSVIATWAANAWGGWLLIPVALLVGTLVGIFSGTVVSKFKVPSFMLTIAMLIGIRGIVNFIQSFIHTQAIPASMSILSEPYIKYPAFVLIVIVLGYVFEYTKIGRYCKAIGENETTARFVGVPVTFMKIVAFAVCGLTVGFGALFSLSSIGGTSQQIGLFFEMRVAMAVFLGGVLVTGGTSAKLYKVLLGSFSITIIVNGLALIGLSQTQYSQSIQGILLLLILGVTILASKKSKKYAAHPEDDEIDAHSEDQAAKA
ncbi:MAG: ABC transporter permease [Clostridiales bacterium]|nr:ABC transporter permease [Clostridiales bacterium]